MAEPGRVQITVLGQTLTLRSSEPPEYLRSLAAYLEERVASLKKAGVKDPLAALTLAALDITDELFHARDDAKDSGRDLGRRLGTLVQILDRLAPPDKPPA